MAEEAEFSDCASVASSSEASADIGNNSDSEKDDDIGNNSDFEGCGGYGYDTAINADQLALSSLGSSWTANAAISQCIEELTTVGGCSFSVALQCAMDGVHNNLFGFELR